MKKKIYFEMESIKYRMAKKCTIDVSLYQNKNKWVLSVYFFFLREQIIMNNHHNVISIQINIYTYYKI